MSYSIDLKHFISDEKKNLQIPAYYPLEIPGTDVNWFLGAVFKKTISTTTALSFSNVSEGNSVTIVITSTSGALATFSDPAIQWSGGVTPTQTADKTDIYTFIKIGSVILGRAYQNYNSNVVPPVSTYSAEVLADSPYFYYKLDETSGTAFSDSSGNNRNATATLGSGLINQTGVVNKCVLFDGSVTKIESNSSYGAVASYSLEAWIKTSDLNGGILAHSYPSGWGPEIYIQNGKIRGYASNGVFVESPLTYNDNQWHHVVYTREDTIGDKLYVDGVLVSSSFTTSSAVNFPCQWVVGVTYKGGEGTPVFLNGEIDEVAYYESVLSPVRILAHYNAAVPVLTYEQEVLTDSPYFYYRFQETSGTAISDLSGNNRNATFSPGGGGLLNQSGPFVGSKSIYFNTSQVQTNFTTGSSAPFSVECWVKMDTFVYNGGVRTFIAHNYSSNNYPWVGSYWDGTIKCGSLGSAYIGGPAVDTLWHHIVMTVAAPDSTKLYIDGVLVDSTLGGIGVTDFNGVWNIGSPNVGEFTGYISEVAIYTTELSAARVLAHYNAGI